MAFQTQELMFGDFEALTQEERNKVIRILYGPKEERKVEFPWDHNVDMVDGGYGIQGDAIPAFPNTMDVREVPVHVEPTTTLQSFSNQVDSSHQQLQQGLRPQGAQQVPFTVIQPQEELVFMAPQSVQVPPGEIKSQQEMPRNIDQKFGQPQIQESNNGPKYERRNKKKRPPDYYEKMEAQRQAQISMQSPQNEIGSWADSYPDDSNRGDHYGHRDFMPAQSQGFDPRQNYPVHNTQPVSVTGAQERVVDTQQSGIHPHVQTLPQPPQQNVGYYQQPTQLSWKQEQDNREVRNEQQNFIQQPHHQQLASSKLHYQPHSMQQQNAPEEGISHVHVAENNRIGEVSQQMLDLHVSAEHAQHTVSHPMQSVPQPQPSLNSQPPVNVTSSQYNEFGGMQGPQSIPVQSDMAVSCADLEHAMVHGDPQGSSGQFTTQTLGEANRPLENKQNVDSVSMEMTSAQNSSSIKSPGKVNELSDNSDLIPQQPDSGASPVQNQPPKPKSWAGLFKNVAPPLSGPVGVVIPRDESVPPTSDKIPQEYEEPKKPVSAEEDNVARQIGELLSTIKINHAQVGLQPRGLINRANWCYINATLQALVACPPFYNLLKKIPAYSREQRGPSSTPVLDSLVEFVHAFTPYVRNNEKGKGRKFQQDITPGLEFEPVNVYKMLQVMQANQTFKLGRQEDAEEFLSCILDGLHEEMSSVIRLATGKEAPEVNANGYVDEDEEEPEEDSWEQVGPKKKSVVTRKATFEKSPIADIFVGYTRSAVFKASAKESANLQPFFTIQLDIQPEKVWNVRDALDGLVSKETISGYTCSKTNTEMEVARKTTLEELPPVLILHLKYFVYNRDGGCQKLLKKVDYAVDLEITKDLLSPNIRTKLSLNQRSYKLFAVVFHHGKQATGGGHYTTAVFHPAINGWILIDDNTVKPVSIATVLKYTVPRVPYLLYYRRLDVNN